MAWLWTIPLGPVVWLTLGALLLMLFDRRLSPRVRQAGPSWLAGTALLFWLLLRVQPAYAPRFWAWRTPLGLDALWGIEFTGWAWLTGGLLLFLLLLALRQPGWARRPGFVDARHWALLLVAACLLSLLAAVWLLLIGVWLILFLLLGLLAGGDARGGSAIWPVGVIAAFLLLAAPLFNGPGSFDTPIQGQQLRAAAQLLLVLALLAPLAAYPAHGWLAAAAQPSPLLHLAPALAALHLLGRFALPLLANQAWALWMVAALLGSALVAWADPERARAQRYLLINRAVWALLVMGLTRLPAPAHALLALSALGLAACLWLLAPQIPSRFAANVTWWLALALFAGLPLTPGFAPTLALGRLAGTTLGLPAWLLALLAQSLFLAALLRWPRPEPAPTQFGRGWQILFLLPVAAALRWGMAPDSLAVMVGVGGSTEFAEVAVAAGAGWAGWLTLLLPLAAGLFLASNDQRLFAALRGWQASIAGIASLEWAGALLHRGTQTVALVLGFFADLVDGAGQFGWVLLSLLVAWLLFAR